MADLGLVYGLCAGVVVKYAGLYWLSRQPGKLVRVGKVTGLVIYPIKSCRGITVESAKVGNHGLEVDGVKDRHWQVVSASDTNKSIWCSNQPKMVLITPSIHGNLLRLDAEGMETLKLPTHPVFDPTKVFATKANRLGLQALDCGDDAAEWLTRFLGKPFRLLHHSPELPPVKVAADTKWGHLGEPGEEASFQMLTPYMLASEDSLDDLNQRLSQPVTMTNFRPNIIVSGAPAYEEDDWNAPITIGESRFRRVKHCTRCPITTVDPSTGIADKKLEPLKTLNRIRKKEGYLVGCFGVQLAVKHCSGNIKVGDDIFAVVNRDD